MPATLKGRKKWESPNRVPIDTIRCRGQACSCQRVSVCDMMHPDVAVPALAAFGHHLRLGIWRILAPYGSLGLPAGAIAARMSIAPSTLSFHLQQMTNGRILVQRRASRQIIYAINGGFIDSLCDFLTSAGGDIIHVPPAALPPYQAGDIADKR
jgi:ArsR family transcriptional regulator